MKIINSFLTFLLVLLVALPASAQEQVEMADTFRAEGKIYVVVAIIIIILTGLFGYLFWLDRKVREVEKKIE